MRVLITLFFLLSNAKAGDWQSHDSILAAARQYLASALAARDDYTIVLRPLDTRLLLRECAQPLLASVAQDKRLLGHTTVQVRCSAVGGWQTYVNAEIYAVQTVVVALRPLARGSRLRTEDVTLVRWPSHQLRGNAFTQIKDVVGLTVKNQVAAQEPLVANQLCLVCKGDSVQMLAGDDRFSVGVSGIAQGYGNLGETIKVLNPSSRRQVNGVVSGPGVIRMGGL